VLIPGWDSASGFPAAFLRAATGSSNGLTPACH
jgi:hypothetical protein